VSLLRLVGLTLFITAIMLALAAAVTQTTHIRLYSGGRFAPQLEAAASTTPPNSAAHTEPILPPGLPSARPNSPVATPSEFDPNLQFETIPIAWPLMIAGGAGLMLWFVQVPPPSRVVRGSVRLMTGKSFSEPKRPRRRRRR
jgi:hypothetical protein